MVRQTNTAIFVMHERVPVDHVVDVAAEAEWVAEIGRRIAALDAGAPTMSWEDARKRIAAV